MATGNIYVKTSQSMSMLVDRQPDSFPIPFPKSVGFHAAIRRGFWAVLKFNPFDFYHVHTMVLR